jgi:hypothetical protein
MLCAAPTYLNMNTALGVVTSCSLLFHVGAQCAEKGQDQAKVGTLFFPQLPEQGIQMGSSVPLRADPQGMPC